MSGLSKRLGAGARAFLVAATLLLAGSGALAADKASPLEMKAREAFAAGRYDEALQTFAKLYAETLHPVYLRNIGRCHQKMREPQKAIDAFKDYLAKSPKSGKDKVTPEERTEIEGYIKEMEALRDSSAPANTPPPPPVQPVQPIQPVQTNPPPPAVTPPPGDPSNAPPAATLTATAPPPSGDESHPVYTRWWFWTIVGVAVVGGVVAAVALSSGGKPDCPAGIKCM
jgi:hypothetical protein